jgi:sugar transferase (PEP-CTERM/EpsH1 system associated)
MMRAKKVLHVVHSLQVGGLENGLANLLNRMKSDRFSHSVLCLTEAGKFAERVRLAGADVLELRLPTGQFRLPLMRLGKLFRKMNPDIVHSRGWPTVDAVFAAHLARVPHIVHGEHGREYSDKEGSNWKRNQIRRVIGHIVDRYVVVCDFFRSWLRETCKVPAGKIAHIPNGVDTEKFCPLQSRRSEQVAANGQSSAVADIMAVRALRYDLGIPPEAIVVGSIGRLDPVKDFPTLLKGFKQISRRRPQLALVIVGDGPIRLELARVTDELGLNPSVKWLGERNDIPELLRSFDVFVQSSLFEGMSNTILEAMASGLPVIATDTGGNAELVQSGKNGMVIPVGDVEALAEALHEYVSDTVLRKVHGENSRNRAVAQFDISVMASGYNELYESLAGEFR